MTIDELINNLQDAKEHCIPGDTQVSVFKEHNVLNSPSIPIGKVDYLDFDNNSVNIYVYE